MAHSPHGIECSDGLGPHVLAARGDDFLRGMAIQTMAINPANPEQVYAGTGEVVKGVGLLRSNDFGDSWQQVAGTESMGTVQRIRFSPDGGTLYAGTENALFRITGGVSLTQIHGGGTDDIEIDPSNPLRIIVSAWLNGKKVIMRIDPGGATTATGAPVQNDYYDFIELAYAPSNPQIVYALTSEQNGRLYRSTDGGTSFQLVSNTGNVNGAFWASALWVNPFDANSLIAGGITLAKSSDGGATWSSVRQSCTPMIVCVWGPVDFHAAVALPGFDNAGNRSMYVAADQGVFRIADLNQGALEAKISGLVTMQSYSMVVDQGSGRVLTGHQDMGTHILVDGQSTWADVGPGDGGFVAIDPRNPNRFYTTVRSGPDRLQLFRWEDPLVRSNVALMRCNEPAYRLPDACDSLGNPESPVVMDLRAPDRIYAGGLRLWRTNNAADPVSPTSGPTWTNLALPGERTGNFISAIAVSPTDSNIVWAARNGGEIYKTTNATAGAPTWEQVGQGRLPGRYPSRITIASQATGMVYATFGGYASDNVWRTFDGGANWDPVTGAGASALPAAPVRDLAVHPAANGAHWLYAATEVGLFASEDAGGTWASAGPSAVRTDQIGFRNQDLLLGTHGRGVWRATVGAAVPMVVPGPPASFRATLTAGTLSATWVQSPLGAAAQQYLLEAAVDPNFTAIVAALPMGAVTQFQYPGVPPGIFYLRVVAQNAAGRSVPSNVQVIGGTPALPPGAPSQLGFTVNGSLVTMTWVAPTTGGAPTNYFIDASTAPGVTNIGSFSAGNALLWYSVTAPNGLYYVRVRAANAAGISGPSNEVAIRVGPEPCTIPPQAPTNLQWSVSGGVTRVSPWP